MAEQPREEHAANLLEWHSWFDKDANIAIKEVKIRRDLEKEVATAGDLQLFSYHLQACTTRSVQACIEGHTFIQANVRRERALS